MVPPIAELGPPAEAVSERFGWLTPDRLTRVRAVLLGLTLFFGLAVYVFHTIGAAHLAQATLVRKLRGVGVLTWLYALFQMVDLRFYNSRWARRRRAALGHPGQPARLAARADARLVRDLVLRSDGRRALVRRGSGHLWPELLRVSDSPALDVGRSSPPSAFQPRHAQHVIARLSQAAARHARSFGLRRPRRARLARRGGRVRRQGHHRRQRQQHGRGESRAARRRFCSTATSTRSASSCSTSTTTASSTSSPIGGWDPQVLVGQRIRFLGRGGDVLGVDRAKADPPHQDGGPRARGEVDRSLDRHRRIEPRGSRRTLERRRSRRDRLEDGRLPEQPHRLALDRRPHRRVRRARGAAALRATAGHGARGRRRDDAGRDRVPRRRRARVHQLREPADGDRRRRHVRHRSSGHREEGGRRPPHRRRTRDLARLDHLARRVRPAAHDRRTASDQVHGARRGARDVHQRRRDPHRARGRRDGARLGAEPLHALAERAGEPRGRRQDGEPHRRDVPRSDEQDGLLARADASAHRTRRACTSGRARSTRFRCRAAIGFRSRNTRCCASA